MKHKHHIVPRHMGGSDDQSNIILLSVDEHAEAHRLLYEQHGKQEDFMAWKMLSGKTEEAEVARIELAKEGFQKFIKTDSALDWKQNISDSLKGHIQSQESRDKKSVSLKKAYSEGRKTYKPIDPDTLRKNYDGDALSEGRRNSMKWKESVTSDNYKLNKCLSDPRSKEVVVNGVSYPSIRWAAKRIGIPYSRLRKLLDGKNFLTLPNI